MHRGSPVRIHDRRRRVYTWAPGIAAGVALAIAGVWYAGSGATVPPQDLPEDVVRARPLTSDGPYFEIVFDRSNLMAEPFENRRKLDHAKDAVLAVLQGMSANDNLAWREFGGGCPPADVSTSKESASAGRVLPFAIGTDRLKARAIGIDSTSGRSTLVQAVTEATGDFNNVPRSNRRAARLVIVTAGFDQCGPTDPTQAADATEKAAAAIRERMRAYPDVHLDLRFIGLALTPENQARTARFAGAVGGTLTNVLTANQLSTAFVQALVIEPKLGDVRTAVATLNDVSEDVNAAIASVGKRDLAAAARALAEAERAFKGSTLPLPEMQQPDGVRKLIGLAASSRDEQRKMLDAVRELITRSEADDADGVAAARRAYNAATVANNKHLGAIEALQRQLVFGSN